MYLRLRLTHILPSLCGWARLPAFAGDFPMSARRFHALLALLSLSVSLLSGCATPPEIKRASQEQLRLLNTLDESVEALQQGVSKFYRDKEALIRHEGLVRLARQAIAAVAEKDHMPVTADQLLRISQEEIQPWLDYAFRAPSLETAIQRMQGKLDREPDPVKKAALQLDVNDLRLRQAQLARKPAAVAASERIVLANLSELEMTQRQVEARLRLLREQVGLMRALAHTIDAWLAADVTASQEQIDAFQEALRAAIPAFKEARP